MTERRERKLFRAKLETMVDAIRDDILSGKYRPGECLPSEKAIAKQYELSNKSVRQGLDTLVSERLIEKIPRVGNRVVDPSESGIVTVKFGYHPTLGLVGDLDRLLLEFRKQHPEVRVHAVPIGQGNYSNNINKMLNKDSFDVVTMTSNGFLDFVDKNGLDDFEALLPNPSLYPFLTKALTYRGELKAQPFLFTPLVLCYNKDHFRERGVPEPDSSWRWHDLFAFADRLAIENERLGFYTHFLSYNRWPAFLLQNGVSFRRHADGTLKLRGTEMGAKLIESMKTYRELVAMQHKVPLLLSENDADAEELFFSGKVSMITTTYFSLNHRGHKPSFSYDIAPLPYLDEARTLLMVIGLALNRSSRVKDGATQLIDFLVSYESQQSIRKHTLSIPGCKAAAEWAGEETIYRPSRFHVFREIVPTYRLISELGLTSKEMDVFTREARLFWSGLASDESFLQRLEQQLSYPHTTAAE